jgi:hypothetical protein
VLHFLWTRFVMNFGTLGPRMKMKPEGFLIRSFLTARVTLIMNWATRLRRITITVSCARMPALFMPLTLGLRSVSKSSGKAMPMTSVLTCVPILGRSSSINMSLAGNFPDQIFYGRLTSAAATQSSSKTCQTSWVVFHSSPSMFQ